MKQEGLFCVWSRFTLSLKPPLYESVFFITKLFLQLGEDKSSKKASKATDSNQSQSKDSRKQETESLVIKLSPDPPLKEASPEWRLPQVQKMNITDDTEAVNEEAKPDVEEKENITKRKYSSFTSLAFI